MSDDIREALHRYAAPGTAPVDGTGRVLDLLDRRRRRRSTVAASAAVLAVLVTVGVVAGVTSGPRKADPAGPLAPGVIVEMSPSPLGARHNTVGAWTGSELVVVGGTLDARCRGEVGDDSCPVPDPTWERGGAAYDPATDSWRRIADAPVPIGRPDAVPWRGEVVVIARPTASATGSEPAVTLAYDPVADAWRTVTERTPFVESARPVVTPQGIVFAASSQQDLYGPSPDRVLDPDRGTWATLPRDPFATSYSRSLTWDGRRLWLLSVSGIDYYEGSERFHSRVAVLEGGLQDGTWRVVERRTPRVAINQVISWSGGSLVVTPDEFGPGFVYDTDAAEFTTVPMPPGADDCPLDAYHSAGAGPGWVDDGGGTLTSADGLTTIVPPCPSLSPDFAVWGGEDLLMWGGLAPDDSAAPVSGYRFRPPAPGGAGPR